MKDNQKIMNQNEYPGFFESALAIHGSVTPKVLKLVLVFTLYACFISFISTFIGSFSIPISPFEYAGLVMGLILVFRINAGYDRWWEARKLWGTIVNNSRNLAIIVANYTRPSNQKHLNELRGFIAAMPYLMKNNLRLYNSIEEVRHLLDESIYHQLQHVKHKPNFMTSKIAESLSNLVENNEMNHFSFLRAEEVREGILDCHGACERILKTPMPFVMAIKSRRFILLFLLILPMAFVNFPFYINPIISTLVSYALISLDQIGIELQNPFSPSKLSHLPIGEICRTIEENVFELFERKPPSEFYLKSDPLTDMFIPGSEPIN